MTCFHLFGGEYSVTYFPVDVSCKETTQKVLAPPNCGFYKPIFLNYG